MVKNHSWGHVGAVKHGSGEHLRDVKRARLDAPASAPASTGTDAEALSAEMMSCKPALRLTTSTEVDLTDETLEEHEFGMVAQALAHSKCRVASLDMKELGFGPTCATTLFASLASNRTLTSLSVARNGLGIAGGRALGAALAGHTSLSRLDLSLNDIAPEGGSALGAALATHRLGSGWAGPKIPKTTRRAVTAMG